ncbi:MAG: Transcriptional regulator, partial [Thermoleophilia bacterium]|nr:Transcriptional regulator [Thermoleophilia bacterium]
MAVALFAPDADAAKFSAAQSSDLVLGATSFTTTASSTATPLLNGLYYPNGVSVDAGGSVYVVDTTNQRVLRWGAAPSSNGEAFSNVLMKDPTVLPGPMQSWWGSTEGPTDGQQVTVSGDGATSAIAIADRGHNRVILSKGETTTNQGASTLGTSRLVLGQPNFSNTGTNIGATGLNNPGDVWTDGTKVAVADQDNHRILLWDSWPTMGQAADHVLGQTGYGAGNVCPNRSILSGTTCNSYTSAPANAAIAADTIRRPKGVTFDGTRLFVADTGNNRVLVWNTWPTTNGQAANYAIGQPDLTTFVTSRGCNATDLSGPIGVAVTTTPVERLAITVQNQNRVVTIDNWSGTAANQHAFTSVIGQTSLVSGCSGNRGATAVGGSAADNSLRDPNDAAFDSAGRLWVADTNNNRVLRFPSMAAGSSADLVLGQSGANALRSSVPNGDVSGNTFFHSYSYVEENGRVAVAPNGALALADPNDDSIRIWNSAPTATNQAYDVRWGQRNRYDSGYQTSNSQRGSATTGDATGVWTDGTRMLVADTNSNRVLVYTSMPASDSAPANYVLGHATFTSTGSGSGLNQMIAPGGVTSDGTSIYVADTGNDRVLVFRNFWATPANGKTADFQLGTAGGGTSATLLSAPAGVDVSQNRLVVADTGNHRIAVYADATGATGASTISAVIGQASYTANGSGGIATDVTQVSVAGNAAFWSTRHQALVLDPVPTSGFVTTGTTLIGTGQALTPSSSSTYSVAGVSARSGTTWVDDAGHARLLRFTDTSNPVIGGPPVATVRCDGTVDISWSFDESTTTEVYWDTVTRGGF